MATPMERAPDPGLEYVPVPKERYTSPEFARLEWEHMWTRTWLCAGRESDLERPGDYFTFEIGPESILVIRQRDGSLAARYNVCMHRGNRLREPGRGHAEKFACLFHGWEYGIDGCLEKALDPESFPQGIDAQKLSLRPVLCDTWAGFVFVCLDPEAGPLGDYLGVIPEHLDPYHFETWKIGYDCTIEIECNWKTCVDAFNEAYHLAATHTWTLEFSDDVNTLYDCYDRHTRMIFPEVQASPRHAEAGTVTAGIKEMFLKRVGVDVEAFEGGPADARRTFAEAIRKIAPSLGADVSELNESQLCDDFHYTVFPNMTFNTHSLFTWVFTHRPHPTDPNKMYFDFISLVNSPGQDVPRPEKELYRTADGDTLAGKCDGGDLLDEDLYNLPRIQAGMQSAAFRDLHLCEQEVRILHHHKTLEGYLERGRVAQGNG
ncbi:MAG: Rieske 2Fe-2S domain-containing protein [Deltaproteobacteria bacterium]|jgi:phenylpropionate dioxygenase-like ring-hydroxylating dioxygenase large terminal subunit|nr:Rieske 2Fe-2S domain-containing protein [Deltaproteobacteria bacterium]MBW2498466.1 Rieske 2Fe-2S domain-containing protein [Deltaproteobacteria bacterium]